MRVGRQRIDDRFSRCGPCADQGNLARKILESLVDQIRAADCGPRPIDVLRFAQYELPLAIVPKAPGFEHAGNSNFARDLQQLLARVDRGMRSHRNLQAGEQRLLRQTVLRHFECCARRPNAYDFLQRLERGAGNILKANAKLSSDELAEWVFVRALSRKPTADERAAAKSLLGDKPTAESLADLLWAIVMLPEFQLVR